MTFDPGGTTGVTFHDTEEPNVITGAQIPEDDHHMSLWLLLHKMMPDIVVCESFEYRLVTNKSGDTLPGVELISRNYIGVIELFCQITETVLVMQSSMVTVGKNFWGDDKKLKKLGVYKKGAPHQNDAMRHFLKYATEVMKLNYLYEMLRTDDTMELR